jgi:hypothetical protein
VTAKRAGVFVLFLLTAVGVGGLFAGCGGAGLGEKGGLPDPSPSPTATPVPTPTPDTGPPPPPF